MILPVAFAAIVLISGLLAAPLDAGAQQPPKVPRVGILFFGIPASPSEPAPLGRALVEGMRTLGWVEGRNVIFEWRYAEGKTDRYPVLAAELVARKVDMIVATSTPAALAVRQATNSIPVVMVAVSDPVGSGLVESLARPGGNVTGLSLLAPQLSAKRLDLFKQAMPKLARAAVLWNTSNAGMMLRFKETEAASRTLGLTIESVGVQGPDDFENAFSAIVKLRPDALLVLADTVTVAHRRRTIDFATANRLPAIYEMREFTDDGGLMSYGISMPDHFRQAATYVDRILKGAKPAHLPVEQPAKFELVINLKTAKALGLTIPPLLLVRADQVIE
jgi:putative tryptophan/tyrosine transport system substrate-binding protein